MPAAKGVEALISTQLERPSHLEAALAMLQVAATVDKVCSSCCRGWKTPKERLLQPRLQFTPFETPLQVPLKAS